MNSYRAAISPSLLLLIIWLTLSASPAAAQESVVAQYFEAPSLYNPAAAGTSGLLDLRAGARIDRADGNLYLISADMPLPVGTDKFGVGITAQRDGCDPMRTTMATARGSFSKLMMGGRLRGGFSVGYLSRNYDYTLPETATTAKLKAAAADIGGGLFFVHPNIWAGVSLAHANAPELDFGRPPEIESDESNESDKSDRSDLSDTSDLSASIKLRVPRMVYAMAGSNVRLSRTIELLPSAMLSSGGGSTWVDVTGRIRYRGLITVGAGWRNARTASLVASVNYKGVFAGYAYAHPLSAAARARSHGIHEIMAGYSLRLSTDRKPGTRHKSIRIM